MTSTHRVVFLTGTRADYGKLKPLALRLVEHPEFDVHIFATGMHVLHKYGATARAVMREFGNVHLYNNQTSASGMDVVLSNTIQGFSNYISQLETDMIIVHGDRPETLAGAIVGSFNNILVSHIEGGEVSGTIDELIRHSVSKLSHLHFVANDDARGRLIQLGEIPSNIFSIGSPDIDIMLSDTLPRIDDVLEHYNIAFQSYALALYHPVTTELKDLKKATTEYISALQESDVNYIVVLPNNDLGCEIVEQQLESLRNNPRFKVFPSIEFESFLTLLHHSLFVIGNSSVGIREAPIYNKWSVNIGSRQQSRSEACTIYNVDNDREDINRAIAHVLNNSPSPETNYEFGDGKSVDRFMGIIQDRDIWSMSTQKQFVQLPKSVS